MNAEVFEQVRSTATDDGITIQKAKKAICLPLSKKIQMGYVPPDSWDAYTLCKRQLSWYHTSPFKGQTLVVSSLNLSSRGLTAETQIRDSKFRCRKFPGKKEQAVLLDRESYRVSKPDVWDRIDPKEKEQNDRWLKVMGIHGQSYDELFITHCANHANFIEPRYFIENGQPVPYSLGKTVHICSACLEFFNIIGSEWKKKLVVPCPGAVLFAGMAPNRYYEVVQSD